MVGPIRSTPTTSSTRHEEYRSQPPRPPNAWILYRSHRFAQIRQNSNERLSQAEVSKRIASMWKHEVEPVRQYFERLAETEKLKHQQLYPDYRFCPQKREDKLRAKEEMKQNRRAQKSKARDATSADANTNVSKSATSSTTSLPSMTHQPYFLPPYPSNLGLPQPFVLPYSLETYYGPGGPSPPISAAPSPASCEASQSPCSDGSSSSSPSTKSSTSSSSQTSSSSSQLPVSQFYIPSLPTSHQPSPNTYAIQSQTPLFQSSTPSQLSLTPLQAHAPSSMNNVIPAAAMWNNVHTQLPNVESQNNGVVNYDIAVDHAQDDNTEFQPVVSGGPSSDCLLPTTYAHDNFSLSHIDNSNLVVPPRGGVDVGMGAQAPIVDYNGEPFIDFELLEFQRSIASLTEAGPSPQTTSSSTQGDFQSFYHPSNNSEVQTYADASQRQSSVYTQDMMNFFNFEAAAGLAEDNSLATSTFPATVALQQVLLQNTQQATEIPVFTQMTNMPTVAPGPSYAPPPGAIHSSTRRRVGGSWKPFPSQTEESVQPWNLSTN